MAITLYDDYIESSTGQIGINTPTPTSALSIGGTVNASILSGPSAGLSGLTKGFEYYTHVNANMEVGGTPKVAYTISSVPAGSYLAFATLNWLNDIGGSYTNDEDAARFTFTASSGTVRSTYANSHEQNLNSQSDGQAGLQPMAIWGSIELSSTSDVYLYFNNVDGDTDAGGFGGHMGIIMWKRAS